MSIMNGTAIVAAVYPYQTLPIRVFFSDATNSSAWSTLPGNHGGNQGISSWTNIASACMFDGYGSASVFVNQYNGTETTGSLEFAFSNDT